MPDRVYLDFNASSPLLPLARAAMIEALDIAANASSVHAEGRRARAIVNRARDDVAALAGADPEQVVFTSCASEAASMLLSPEWRRGRTPVHASHLYVCAADHVCTLSGGRFEPDDMTTLPVGHDGILAPATVEAALSRHDHAAGLPVLCVHHANNETGVVQPVEAIGRIVKDAGGIMVIDAVQSAGRLDIRGFAEFADFLIVSAHKIGGPKGAGAVIAASDRLTPVALVKGGGQERGHRGGTENVAAIAGFGAAARLALPAIEEAPFIGAMRDRFERAILAHIPDAVFFGRGAARIANTTAFAIPGMKAETAQIAFDLAGVALSAGSACSSGKVGPSHVLEAMGQAGEASALRVSIGPDTGEAELRVFTDALAAIAARRRGDVRAA